MIHFLTVLFNFWNNRYYLILPAIVISLIALFISMSQPVLFKATTTLYLDKAKAESPLLKNITESDHGAILERTLKGQRILKDTLEEVGLLIAEPSKQKEQQAIKTFADNIEMEVLNDHLIKISYESLSPQNIETILETLSFNFIHEILAPERFRTEQLLSSLASQIKYYSEKIKLAKDELKSFQNKTGKPSGDTLKKVVSLEFDIEKFISQKRMAQEEYDSLLTTNKSLVSQYSQAPNSVLWFIEAPAKLPEKSHIVRHLEYMFKGLILAIFLSIGLIIYRTYTDTSLRTEEEFRRYLGLKIIGHMPNLGNVVVEDGAITADIRANI